MRFEFWIDCVDLITLEALSIGIIYATCQWQASIPCWRQPLNRESSRECIAG